MLNLKANYSGKMARFSRQIKEMKLLVQSQNSRSDLRDIVPRIYNLYIYVNRTRYSRRIFIVSVAMATFNTRLKASKKRATSFQEMVTGNGCTKKKHNTTLVTFFSLCHSLYTVHTMCVSRSVIRQVQAPDIPFQHDNKPLSIESVPLNALPYYYEP